MTVRAGEGRVREEVRSDGDTVWLRIDTPAVEDELPAGVHWVEAPYDDMVAAGVINDLPSSWDPLLFLRSIDEVEDGGVGQVDGEPVRILRGRIDYEAAYDPDDTVSLADVPGVLPLLGASSDQLDPEESDDPEDPNDPRSAEVLERDPPEPVPPAADTPPGSLEPTTLIEGHGPPAAAGDSLRVHYVLVTADGTVVDSSWERGEPFPLTLGAGEVIAGWDQGLVGARAGERQRLVVGSDLAYGHEGSSGDDVPPDAPLAFEVDVVEILPGG